MSSREHIWLSVAPVCSEMDLLWFFFFFRWSIVNRKSKGIHLNYVFGLGIKYQYTNCMDVGVLFDFRFVSQGWAAATCGTGSVENNVNWVMSCARASLYFTPALWLPTDKQWGVHRSDFIARSHELVYLYSWIKPCAFPAWTERLLGLLSPK